MGLALSAMLVPLGSTMIAVALPSIGLEFGRAAAELTPWLVNSYLLISILALGPGGKLGDHWGLRNTLRAGQALFGLGCLLPIVWPAFGTLVVSRMLMALGGAFMLPSVMALVRRGVPADRRHRAFGTFGAMMGLAAALGPSLGGLLVHRFGWASVFLINLPALVLSVALSRGFFRAVLPGAAPAALRFDAIGTLLRFDLGLLSNRHFAAGCAVVALQNLGMYALLFQLPYLFELVWHWGPERSGHHMTAFMVSMTGASLLGGRVAESLGVRATCIAGSLLSVAGLAILSRLTAATPEGLVLAGLLLGGAGLGLANGPAQSAAMTVIEAARSGAASGVLSTFRYLGGVVGISVLGWLLSGSAAKPSIASHHLATTVFAGAFGLAALVALRLPGASR